MRLSGPIKHLYASNFVKIETSKSSAVAAKQQSAELKQAPKQNRLMVTMKSKSRV